MSEIAVSLKNVSKCFKRYPHPADRLKELFFPGKSRAEEFWALRDINLEVLKGQTLGIVGQNGSGKSTLLQIIAGTLTPTTGDVWVNGRVSALLELGSGFNPEFTGRQNVFFNGQILGLSQSEIEYKFDDIAKFADIGDFIDQPVKTYSSGMFVRLAFAVVANTDPKILVVDEALAVGDAKFQARCMKRIRELKEQGVTILFVSHDSSSVKMLCQRAVLLNKGKMLTDGDPKDVVNRYIALLSSDTSTTETENINPIPVKSDLIENVNHQKKDIHRHGNKFIVINSVKITDSDNIEIAGKIETGSIFNIVINLEAKEEISDLVIGISIRNLMGVVIYGANTHLMNIKLPILNIGQEMSVSFEIPCSLNRGVYTVTVGIHSEEGMSYDWMDEILILEVINQQVCDGLVDLNSQIKIHQLYSSVIS
ncbi:ABC transporter ATP-binding protein [Limnofasciculus baicalensis]|uniref:ABC transporter ATP-binding protein n=2 Tax=Limnofasciculus TaxID=3064905 RepID=A0AAE3GPP0_9CYAN|nr:ABC transporter ATP-binding protein [Limnofasciculus baicalensis]MCP2727767.1 ABC transporter ATP-binding protein [Limnofasciculus baicalensis BBK-W-15]